MVQTTGVKALHRIRILVATGLAIAAAASAGARSGRPSARLDEVVKDLGAVPSNRKVEVRWTLHNDGDAPLEISAIRPSCDCVSAEASAKRVPPAGEATVVVTFDPAGLAGEKRESISLRTNDPARSEVFLVLRAHVSPPVLEGLPASHPPTSGQNFLLGTCAACHAQPAAGKSGADLYVAVCAMCHGAAGEGGLAPSLRSPVQRPDGAKVSSIIALGTADPRMPGFGADMAGPLSAGQIESLTALLASWAGR